MNDKDQIDTFKAGVQGWAAAGPLSKNKFDQNRRIRQVQEAASSMGMIYPNPDDPTQICPKGYIRVTIAEAWTMHSSLVDGDYFIPRERIQKILDQRRTKEERDDFFYEEDDLTLEDLDGPAIGEDLKLEGDDDDDKSKHIPGRPDESDI